MKKCDQCGQTEIVEGGINIYHMHTKDGERVVWNWDGENWPHHDLVDINLCEPCLWQGPSYYPISDDIDEGAIVIDFKHRDTIKTVSGFPVVELTDEEESELEESGAIENVASDNKYLKVPRGLYPNEELGDYAKLHFHPKDSKGYRYNAWIHEDVEDMWFSYCGHCSDHFATSEDHSFIAEDDEVCAQCFAEAFFGESTHQSGAPLDHFEKTWGWVSPDTDFDDSIITELVQLHFFKRSKYFHFDIDALMNGQPDHVLKTIEGWVGTADDMHHSRSVRRIEEEIQERMGPKGVWFAVSTDRSTQNICTIGWDLWIWDQEKQPFPVESEKEAA